MLANEATKFFMVKRHRKKLQILQKKLLKKGKGSDLPVIEIQSIEIKKGVNILDLIAKNNILPSKSEARRAISNKGIRIDDNIIKDEKKFFYL